MRYVEPTEWAQVIVECLKSSGFFATVTQDGGIEFDEVPAAQAQSLDVANYICTLQYPVNPKYEMPLNEAQIQFLYEYYVYDLVPCLEALGHSISEPPSSQRFAETYGASEMWSPYADVLPSSDNDWFNVNKACPQVPAGLYG